MLEAPANIFGCLLWHIEREVRQGNNKTCTSKPQAWSKPSEKQIKRHGPELLSSIHVKKPKVNCLLVEEEKVIPQRASFDPQALHQVQI